MQEQNIAVVNETSTEHPLSGDEGLSKGTCDDHTTDIANEDPDNLNKLGDGDRGIGESNDLTIIYETVASNLGDTRDQKSTVTTKADRKIKKLAHLKDYF